MQQLQGRVGGGGGEGWEVSAEERGALLAVAALMICAAVLFSTAVQQYFSVKQNRAIVGLEETLKELNSESVSGVLWTYEICCRRGFIKKRSDAIEIFVNVFVGDDRYTSIDVGIAREGEEEYRHINDDDEDLPAYIK